MNTPNLCGTHVLNGKYSPVVSFILLYGSYTKSEKLTAIQPLVNKISLSQWQDAINSTPNLIQPSDVAVVMNSNITSVWALDAPTEKDPIITIKFNVPAGIYNIALRCITPAPNCDSCFIQLDSEPGNLWTIGLGEGKTMHKENTVFLLQNKTLTDGDHVFNMIYREPMAFIEVIITEKTNAYPQIKIPVVNVLMNPFNVYGRQTQPTTYKPLESTYTTTFSPKPSVKFPPQTFSPTVMNVSGMGAGDGLYGIKMSTGDWKWSSAYKLFDGNKLYGSNGSGINVPSAYYNPSDKGYYTGPTTTTDTTGKTHKGEWVDVYFPVKFFLYLIYIYRLWSGGQPYDIVVLGSNDKTNWNMLLEKSSTDYEQIQSNPDAYRAIVDVGSSVAYSSYRVVIKRVGAVWSNGVYYGGKAFNISEMEFYGSV
jgi:hypothetical protein